MKNKFIFNFTPTGMIPTKEMTEHVPIPPEEIVNQVLEAVEAWCEYGSFTCTG